MRTLDFTAAASARALDLCVPPHLRETAIATWSGRMTNEAQSSYVFEALGEQLDDAGLGANLGAAARAFAREELRHGELCGAVVEALGGSAVAGVEDQPRFPMHPGSTRREAALRNLLSIGCLSETVAVSLIGAEREEMPEGPLRELLTQIWADEIGHARFGWTLVAAHAPLLTAEERAQLAAYLPVALRHLERHELAHLPDAHAPGAGSNELGLCSGRDARVLFYATVERVILPRLDALGLPARSAWASRHALRAA